MMKLMFALTMIFSGISAMASTYTLVPDNATKPDCVKLGMTGDFVIRKNSKYESPRARDLVFLKTSESLVVSQSRSNQARYTSVVRCSFGCVGAMEVFVDLELGEFEYKNDIWFPETGKGNDDLCRGAVR